MSFFHIYYRTFACITEDTSKFNKPLFYVDKGRYEQHVIRVMTREGYRQLIHCANCEQYRGQSWSEEEVLRLLKFVWLRNRAGFPWKLTASGSYIWNHLPNEFIMTKKHYLAMNIRKYVKAQGDKLSERMREVHPETFVLENDAERILFFEAIEQSEKKRKALQQRQEPGTLALLDNTTLWIIKPVDSSGGNGIGVVDSFQEFAEQYLCEKPAYVPRAAVIRAKASSSSLDASSSESSTNSLIPADYNVKIGSSGGKPPATPEEALQNPAAMNLCRSLIAQRYIASPLLLNGHKFDIRAYMYIADVGPPLVFYHDGYLRVNIEPYDTDNLDNKWSHISNIGLQKVHPEYEQKKVESKWSFKTWQKHMLDKGLTQDPDWVTNVIKPQLRSIMEVAYRSVLPQFKEHAGFGCFALLGVDFLIDSNHRAWLLEYTKTPAGHSTLEADDTLFADMMDELIAMQLELHNQKRLHGEAYPADFSLTTQKDFVRIV